MRFTLQAQVVEGVPLAAAPLRVLAERALAADDWSRLPMDARAVAFVLARPDEVSPWLLACASHAPLEALELALRMARLTLRFSLHRGGLVRVLDTAVHQASSRLPPPAFWLTLRRGLDAQPLLRPEAAALIDALAPESFLARQPGARVDNLCLRAAVAFLLPDEPGRWTAAHRKEALACEEPTDVAFVLLALLRGLPRVTTAPSWPPPLKLLRGLPDAELEEVTELLRDEALLAQRRRRAALKRAELDLAPLLDTVTEPGSLETLCQLSPTPALLEQALSAPPTLDAVERTLRDTVVHGWAQELEPTRGRLELALPAAAEQVELPRPLPLPLPEPQGAAPTRVKPELRELWDALRARDEVYPEELAALLALGPVVLPKVREWARREPALLAVTGELEDVGLDEALLLAWTSRRRALALAAREFARRHPERAAVAAGRLCFSAVEKEAAVGLVAFRELERKAGAFLHALDAPRRAWLEAQLGRRATLPARLPKVPAFVRLAALPPVVSRDGAEALSAAAVERLVRVMKATPADDGAVLLSLRAVLPPAPRSSAPRAAPLTSSDEALRETGLPPSALPSSTSAQRAMVEAHGSSVLPSSPAPRAMLGETSRRAEVSSGPASLAAPSALTSNVAEASSGDMASRGAPSATASSGAHFPSGDTESRRVPSAMTRSGADVSPGGASPGAPSAMTPGRAEAWSGAASPGGPSAMTSSGAEESSGGASHGAPSAMTSSGSEAWSGATSPGVPSAMTSSGAEESSGGASPGAPSTMTSNGEKVSSGAALRGDVHAANEQASPSGATLREPVAASTLGAAVVSGEVHAPAPLRGEVAPTLAPESLAALAGALCCQWLGAGAPPKEKWALTALGHFPSDAWARVLGVLSVRWAQGGFPARAQEAIAVLGRMGSREALAQVHHVATKVRTAGLRARAREAFDAAAARLGLTGPELEDRLFPDVAVPPGATVTLDGAKASLVRDGRPLKPQEDLKSANKQLRAAIARLERLMCEGAPLSALHFTETWGMHPVLRVVAERLVWGLFRGEARVGLFVPTVPPRGDAVPPDDALSVRPVHLLELAPDERARVADWVARPQPFEQLERECFSPAKLAGFLAAQRGREVPVTAVLRLERLGWERERAHDGGLVTQLVRRGDGFSATFTFEPGLFAGDPLINDEQVVVDVELESSRPLSARVASELQRELSSLG